MRIDPNPLFRRVITPWYDGPVACWILLLAMAAVACFGWAGIRLALSNDAFRGYIWMPTAIAALSLFVCASVICRLLRRHFDRRFPSR